MKNFDSNYREHARSRACFCSFQAYGFIVSAFLTAVVPKIVNAQNGWMPLMNEQYRAIAVARVCEVIASADGKLLRSGDHGSSWELSLYDTNVVWGGVCASSDSEFIAVGSDGTISISSQGGRKWNDTQFLPTTGWSSIASPASHKFAVVGSVGAAAFSTDEGNSWQQASTNIVASLHDIVFATQLVGLAVGDNGTILRSTDGGEHWSSISSGISQNLWSVRFRDSLYAAATGENGTLLISRNGGLNWVAANPDNLNHFVVRFNGDSTILLAGYGSAMLRSDNLGGNWDTAFYYGIDQDLTVSSIEDDSGKLMLVGSEGLIAFSSDTGLTWSPIAFSRTSLASGLSSRHFNDIVWADSETCYIVADESEVLRSRNAGITWMRLENFPYSSYFLNAYFWNKDSGFVGGSNAALFETYNGGDSWQNIGNDTVHYYARLSTPAPSDFIFAGNDSCVFRTQDLHSWDMVFPGFCKELDGMAFPAPDIGFLAGESWTGDGTSNSDTYYSHILRSLDSGKTWSQVFQDTGYGGNFYFLSRDTGYFAGRTNGLFMTTNSGTSWHLIFRPSEEVASVFFLNSQEGYVSDGYTHVYHTLDGGANWSIELTTNGGWLRLSPTGDLFVGSRTFIMKKSVRNGPPASVTNTVPNSVPYLWVYDWPNPASSQIHCQVYCDPELKGIAKLRVIDMLGREVADLTSDIKQNGFDFESSFDADISALRMGAYSLLLTAGNSSFSRLFVIAR